MQNEYLDDATRLADIIEKYFGKKVSAVTPVIDTTGNKPWYCVEFVLYRTYRLVYEYERGFFSVFSANTDKDGVCILLSAENIKRFDNNSSNEGAVIQNLRLLDSEIRLRLPDKFLSTFD